MTDPAYLFHEFLLSSFKGVPGEGGAAGATGPRVSCQSVFNVATVCLTD